MLVENCKGNKELHRSGMFTLSSNGLLLSKGEDFAVLWLDLSFLSSSLLERGWGEA
jgi:hypothetical protein